MFTLEFLELQFLTSNVCFRLREFLHGDVVVIPNSKTTILVIRPIISWSGARGGQN